MTSVQIQNHQLVDGRVPADLLPENTVSLNFAGCIGLNALPDNLPAGITSLDLSRCTGLNALPNDLPAGITSLYLTRCTGLNALPDNLPAGITDLNLRGCTGLNALPDNLPAGITDLNLSGCTGLNALPDNLPGGITSLNLSGCTGLNALPDNLSAGITSLDLSGCTGLNALPDNLPAGITYLDLTGCTGLNTLPDNLPAGMTYLDLTGCTNLIATPQLLLQLATLERNGCAVVLPEHLSKNYQSQSIKDRLNAVISRYYSVHQDESKNSLEQVKILFHRFLTEDIGQRDGIWAIVASTLPIIELLEQNPEHLTWAEKIASVSLDGCVNQPVRGLSEITAWVSVAKAEGIAAKIEAAKQLLVFHEVTHFVKQNPIGSAIEVEAGNALYRDLHKKLLEEGKIRTPWVGVPQSISHEVTIDSWKAGKVEAIFPRASALLEKTLPATAETLCETDHRDNWIRVAFGDNAEVQKIMTEYVRRKGDALLVTMNDRVEIIKSKLLSGKTAEQILGEFEHEERKDNTPESEAEEKATFAQLVDVLTQSPHIKNDVENFASLDNEEKTAIATKVRELTFAASAEVTIAAAAAAAADPEADESPSLHPQQPAITKNSGKNCCIVS